MSVVDDTRRTLGLRVRDLRRRTQLTTRELAERAGLSASLINQIETGRSGASYVSLRRIASALGVPLTELMLEDAESRPDGQAPAAPRVTRLVKASRRKRLQFPGSEVTFELLTPDLQGALELVWSELQPREDFSEPLSHGGEECSVVLRGTVEWIVGEERFTMEEGDAITFDASRTHQWRNPGTEPAIVLTAVTPPTF